MDLLLMLIPLLGLAALGSSRLDRYTWIVAAQGVVLGALLLMHHGDHLTIRLVVLAAASVGLKAVVFPLFIFRSMREANIKREIEPYIGYTVSLVLGAVVIGVAFGMADLLTLPYEQDSHLIVPVSLATVFMGLILIVGRHKAVTQVLGYIVMENGIFVFSLALVSELPLLVETGVLLDLFVAVFVMGITIFQINREFDHIDAAKLSELEDRTTGRRNRPSVHFGNDHGNDDDDDDRSGNGNRAVKDVRAVQRVAKQ